MAATLTPPRLLPSGDAAITVEFSRDIDDPANQRVLTLDRAHAADPIAGVTETVPTYRSLLVHYDPVTIGFEALGEKLLYFIPEDPKTFNAANNTGIPVVLKYPKTKVSQSIAELAKFAMERRRTERGPALMQEAAS